MGQAVFIVVRCRDCGEVRVDPGDVTLRDCVDDDGWSDRFRCPECARVSVAPTNRPASLEAAIAGATVERWHLPAELREPRDGDVDDLERTLAAAIRSGALGDGADDAVRAHVRATVREKLLIANPGYLPDAPSL